ncbi:LrgB family protein, partial [Kribbia dieselivorans]|uniref:LrgB family protein n=1 Tax=Kribbia dieselivorans TaxID=331526 RepID=UPI000A457917
LLTPVMVAMAIIGLVLWAGRIDYATYMRGGAYLSFVLGPATVALAVPLHRAWPAIRRLALPIVVGVICGAAAAIIGAVVSVRMLGGTEELALTMAPKSATTPISIALSAQAGGIAELTAVFTVLTGVIGAAFGPWLLGLVRVRDPQLQGLAIGVSSHGIGTARALQEGPLIGAFAALAMALSGVATSVLLPVMLFLLR